MNKNYILSFFLINLFAIFNIYPTILRTIVFKHKVTGQRVVLYGDLHWGLKNKTQKDDIQFKYISKLLDKDKENLTDKLAVLYEGDANTFFDKTELKKSLIYGYVFPGGFDFDPKKDGIPLIAKITLAGKDKWKDFAHCVDNRLDLWKLTDENTAADLLQIMDQFIENMNTSISKNASLSKALKNEITNGLNKIQTFKEEVSARLQEFFNCDLKALSEEKLKLKNYKKYGADAGNFLYDLCMEWVLAVDFFDLNALNEIVNSKKPTVAVFAGDTHIRNLRDALVKDSDYEIKYDSELAASSKKSQNVADARTPVKNKDFDFMLLPGNISNVGA